MAQPKPYYNIVKNEAAREATIYIYGPIGGMDWETWKQINTASSFSDDFKEVEKDADTIHIRLNSPGGLVFEGLAIYNTIFGSKKKIITYNDGLCASMAALILLAGDEIHSFQNSLLMIHNSSSGYWGNKKEVEEQLQASEKIDKALGTAIEERLGISKEEVEEKYLNYKDNWFTADEALEEGFIDNIIKKNKGKLPEDTINLTPVQMIRQYAAMTFDIPDQKSKITNTMSKKPVSFPRLEAALGLSAPLATTDKGSYILNEQKETLDSHIAGLETQVKNAKDAKETAETALQEAKDSHAEALKEEEGKTEAALKAMRTAAEAAGVEDLAEDASMEDINTALTAKIAELNKKPGATHTNPGASAEEDDKTPSWVNKEAYKNMAK